eukprot:GHVR01187986.1.p2 GENE.GHVR01187986.1~~GHVR01187986.1.p2  ORF type:complete len:147 (+),score=12.55 GHVR01187986.1:847-1287(+)
MGHKPRLQGKSHQPGQTPGAHLEEPKFFLTKTITKRHKVAEAQKTAKRIGILPLGIVIRGNMLRAASMACTLHGSTSDPITQAQIKDLRTAFSRALLKTKYMASSITALLITSRGWRSNGEKDSSKLEETTPLGEKFQITLYGERH